MANRVTADVVTPVGILSFPHVHADTVEINKKTGEKSYEIQILIPKSERAAMKKIMEEIKRVGQAKMGEGPDGVKWKKLAHPVRDGDKEKDELTEDGSTREEKYPERLGHWFLNARSKKPVGVVDRSRTPIEDSDELYGGCKGKIHITLYPYSAEGKHGIGAGLNGVQKIGEGEPLGGGGKPSVESMFDILDDEDDEGLTDDVDIEEEEADEKPAPRKRAAAKKATTTRTRKKPEPEPVDVDDDEDDLYDEDDLDDVDDDDI